MSDIDRRDVKGDLSERRGEAEQPMAIGYGVVGATIGGGAVGYLLDRAFDSYPWLLLSGAIVGLCVWFYALSVALRRRG